MIMYSTVRPRNALIYTPKLRFGDKENIQTENPKFKIYQQ